MGLLSCDFIFCFKKINEGEANVRGEFVGEDHL